MNFKLGLDLGIVMSKGIVCSLLMVIFFMPSLLLSWSDRIDRMQHKPLLPKFQKLSIVVTKISPVILVVSLLLVVPFYTAQSMNNFVYGTDATGAGPGTSMYEHTAEVDEKFGRSNLIVAIVPEENMVKEKALTEELGDLSYVKKVMSMAQYLPEGIPEDYLPSSVTEIFHKNGYSRLLIYTRTKAESEYAYEATNEISSIIREYYPEECYITGNTPATQDMATLLVPDNKRTNVLSVVTIFIIVALSFRTLAAPFATMLPILMAVIVNMSIPYLKATKLIFIGYLVVQSIQLGSTIDYAISCTENYISIRQNEPDKKKAAQKMVEMSFPSILTSGLILIICGYAVGIMASIPAVSQVGQLVGRGAICSLFFVVTMMPFLLQCADKAITVPFAVKHAQRRAVIRQVKYNIVNRRRERYRRIKRVLDEKMHSTNSNSPENHKKHD